VAAEEAEAEAEAAEAAAKAVEVAAEAAVEVAVEADLLEDSHLPPQQQHKLRHLRQMETEGWLGRNRIFSMDREAKATSSCRNLNST
jgi:hypothetical protein